MLWIMSGTFKHSIIKLDDDEDKLVIDLEVWSVYFTDLHILFVLFES